MLSFAIDSIIERQDGFGGRGRGEIHAGRAGVEVTPTTRDKADSVIRAYQERGLLHPPGLQPVPDLIRRHVAGRPARVAQHGRSFDLERVPQHHAQLPGR